MTSSENVVLQVILDMPGDVAPQQAVHWCQLQEYRGSQQDQLQHQVRPQDPDDHLPRHGPPRLHGLPLDHRQLDTEAVWEVREFWQWNQENIYVEYLKESENIIIYNMRALLRKFEIFCEIKFFKCWNISLLR